MLVVCLLAQRKITALMSSYQILRVALQTIGRTSFSIDTCTFTHTHIHQNVYVNVTLLCSLASSDWSTAGISMATPDPSHVRIVDFIARLRTVQLTTLTTKHQIFMPLSPSLPPAPALHFFIPCSPLSRLLGLDQSSQPPLTHVPLPLHLAPSRGSNQHGLSGQPTH